MIADSSNQSFHSMDYDNPNYKKQGLNYLNILAEKFFTLCKL